jgi:hypothetical protein
MECCPLKMPCTHAPDRGVEASAIVTTMNKTSGGNHCRVVLSELDPTFDDSKRGTARRLLPSLALAWLPLLLLCKPDSKRQYRGRGNMSIQKEHVMRKVLRGYAKDRDGNLILIGTISAPHSKDKASPREHQDKRHLIRQGATIFKKEIVR